MNGNVINFFVHPERDMSSYCDNETSRAYLKILKRIATLSDYSVLVSSGRNDPIFRELIPQDYHLEDVSYMASKRGRRITEGEMERVMHGEVAPSDWNKLLGILSKVENPEIRIHGAYFGECTQELGVQLLAHINRGFHLHNWFGFPMGDFIVKKDKELIRELEVEGAMTESSIRYGTVLSHPKKRIKVINPSIIPSFIGGCPKGNIAYQMIDSKTQRF